MNYKIEAYSIAAITILMAGLIRLYIYYKGFNISILPFLEPGEITTIFFDNLLYFLGFAVLNVLVISIMYSEVLGQFTTMTETDFLARLCNYGIFKISKLITLIVFSSLLYWIYSKTDNIFLYEFLLWIVLLITAIYINPILIFEFKKVLFNKSIEVNQLSIYFLMAAVNLFAFSGLSGLNEANKVKNHGYYEGTEITIDGYNTFTSSDKKYYIGKTKQFIFFYDSEKKETDVIPISSLKKMKFN